MPLRSLLFAALCGCDTIGPSAGGQWSGSCDLEPESSYDEAISVWFELDIHEEDDGRVKGDGEFFYEQYEFEGLVRGHRDEAKLELELEGSDDGHSTRLEIVGDIVEDRVDGWCTFYGVSGALEMKR